MRRINIADLPDSFKNLLRIVVPGWTIGVTVIFIPFAIFALIAIPLSDAGFSGEKIASVFILVLIPFIAFLQSLLISAVCYLGIQVYKWHLLKKLP